MNFLNDLCFLCLVHSKNIKSVLSQGEDDIIIEEKLKSVLSELVTFLPEIPKSICTDCLKGLNYVYKFKQKCLQNLVSLSDYLNKITETMTFEHFLSSSYSEDQYENEQNGVEEEQSSDSKFKNSDFHKNYAHLSHLLTNTTGITIRHVNDKTTSDSNSESQMLENGNFVTQAVPNDINGDGDLQDELYDDMEGSYESKELSENINGAATPDKTVVRTTSIKLKPQYTCRQCHKVFFCSTLLERHIRTHDTQRYKCPTCFKTFKRPEHLKTHFRIHTGEKPYKCEVCNKAFTAQSNYISHKRIHYNQQPFKCTLCDKAFTQSNNLTMHMRVHTGEKPYECEFCDYKCAQSNNLKIHIRTHSGDRECKYCKEEFSSMKYLLQHIRMTHQYKSSRN